MTSVYLLAERDGRGGVGLAATWDEEHLKGARFVGPVLVELNGSILEP